MIESEVKRERLTEIVHRWIKHTKVDSYLRPYDVPNLVGQILEGFYHIVLCCGHYVRDMDEGILLELDEGEGMKAQGLYCQDCADQYVKEGFAKIKRITTSLEEESKAFIQDIKNTLEKVQSGILDFPTAMQIIFDRACEWREKAQQESQHKD